MIIFDLRNIPFDEILPVWSTYLWKARVSEIAPTSAIKYGTLPYEYDISYMDSEFHGVGAYFEDFLIGVNSVHNTGGSQWRSRGLFVFDEFRGNGVGQALLKSSIDIARKSGMTEMWTMPKQTSLTTYEKSGFVKTSDWFTTETSTANCYAKYTVNKL